MASSPVPDPAGAWLVRRYPGWWRERYADEVLALLEDRPPSRRDRLDLAHGAIDAHLRGPGGRSTTTIAAALIAGGAWTMVGAASITQPTPLDWPGYDIATLPVVTLAALAATVADLGLARRAWPASTGRFEVLLVLVAVSGLAWAGALLLAALGGPYGAVTAAVQAVAAVMAVGLGVTMLRIGVTIEGSVVLVMAVALLIPTPAAWLGMGAGWTAVGIVLAQAPGTDAPPFGAA